MKTDLAIATTCLLTGFAARRHLADGKDAESFFAARSLI
jgi:hypothetical protein